jgi:preprotein translocase subunit SecY
MLKTLRHAWKAPELRSKMLFTLLIVIIFRIGAYLPVPFLDAGALGALIDDSGSIMNILDTFSGGALSQGSLFALAIQPYINASIIMQLLTYALPPLENLSKEGETGRKKIQLITSIVALAISVAMSYAYYATMRNLNAVTMFSGNTFANVFVAVIIIASFTAGAQLVVWLGNRINERGLGNGISIILFTGIISRGPSAIFNMFIAAQADQSLYIAIFFIGVFFVAMIGFIVFMNESERRIPVQYAKRVVGRKQYGGQSSFIPIKIAMSGVMPIIFAMALMSFPSTIALFIPRPEAVNGVELTFLQKLYAGFLDFFNYTTPWYAILYFLLIIAFNFFYVSMQYDPTKIANQLRQNNGGIPGIRPGKPTADYIKKVLSKITIVGAFFLGVIAIVPILTGVFVTQIRISMGGTTILIIVSVILETIRMLESQMMMRHHKGFLE